MGDSPQFPTPIPGLWGYGPTLGCAYNPMPPAERAEYCAEIMDFRMVDLVKIPENLPPGEYALSFRWDCEQTPQIWTQCADVKITATGSPSPSPTPPTTTPAPGCSDNNQYCEDWAASGQCDANPNYMLESCRKSCGVCSLSAAARREARVSLRIARKLV